MLYNEYEVNKYFWEFIKIYTKILVLIITKFYLDLPIMKTIFIVFIIYIYLII